MGTTKTLGCGGGGVLSWARVISAVPDRQQGNRQQGPHVLPDPDHGTHSLIGRQRRRDLQLRRAHYGFRGWDVLLSCGARKRPAICYDGPRGLVYSAGISGPVRC